MKKMIVVVLVVCAAATAKADTTDTLNALQVEYEKTARSVSEQQAQLLRLEGAIAILKQMQKADEQTTTAIDAATTNSKQRFPNDVKKAKSNG